MQNKNCIPYVRKHTSNPALSYLVVTKSQHPAVRNNSRDTPPHLHSDSALEVTDLKVNEILETIKGPIDDIPEDAKIVNFESKDIPQFLSLLYCMELNSKLRIINAIRFRYDYLC